MGYRTTKTKNKVKVHKTIESRTDFFYYAFRNILLVGLPLVLISGFVLSHLSLHSSATVPNSETDNLTLTLSTSCTLSSSVEEAHTASLNGGQYEDDIGITKVNAYCNDNNGYSIYAIGSSGDTDGNTDLISNINDNYNIHTGIYNSSSITASSPSSSWSMKLTAGVGSGINTTPPTINNNYSNYNIVPNIYTLVASRASKTDMAIDTSVTGSYFTTTYDIYASSLQPAGTYTGKVKYLMVHPQSNNQYFGFNEVFAANGKGAINVDGNSYYAMQDMTSDICSKVGFLNEASATQLVDIRDNKLYWVAKLEDGHCWMTQNLDLDIGGANTQALTSENTDISVTASGSGIYSDGYSENNGIWTWTPASTAVTAGKGVNYSTNTVSNWNHNNTTPASAEGGNTYFYTSGNNNNDTRYDSLELCKVDHSETDCLHYHVGNYYNWTAAIASNASSGISADTTRADNSICPRGWRLPNTATTDNAYNEFGRLFYAYNVTNNLANGTNSVGYKTGGFNALRTTPLWFVRSGGINNGYLGNSSSIGSYWSSVSNSKDNAYHQEFSGSGIWPAYNYYKFYGFSVRCLARTED